MLVNLEKVRKLFDETVNKVKEAVATKMADTEKEVIKLKAETVAETQAAIHKAELDAQVKMAEMQAQVATALESMKRHAALGRNDIDGLNARFQKLEELQKKLFLTQQRGHDATEKREV